MYTPPKADTKTTRGTGQNKLKLLNFDIALGVDQGLPILLTLCI